MIRLPKSRILNETKVMLQVFITLLSLMALAYSAAIPGENQKLNRQKRTLGLVTAGAGAVSEGIGAAGAIAATAVGILSAVKPLIILGLGKCKNTVFL